MNRKPNFLRIQNTFIDIMHNAERTAMFSDEIKKAASGAQVDPESIMHIARHIDVQLQLIHDAAKRTLSEECYKTPIQ